MQSHNIDPLRVNSLVSEIIATVRETDGLIAQEAGKFAEAAVQTHACNKDVNGLKGTFNLVAGMIGSAKRFTQ